MAKEIISQFSHFHIFTNIFYIFAGQNYTSISILGLFEKIIGTGFGVGYWRYGPGTAGALLALALWWLAGLVLAPTWLCIVTVALTIIFTFLGTWAADRLETIWGKDPHKVVVDEMVGMWIPLIIIDAQASAWLAVVAFILFRVFDIFKPFGIRRMEDLKGGFGVMADDILAGVYSLVIILLIEVTV